SFTFSAGDNIYFKKGETWREKLTVPSSGSSGTPITFGAYGSGNAPIITGADSMSGFSDGGSNIWDKTGVTTQPNVVIVNGADPQAMAASRAAVTSVGSWFWGSDTLSVYATSDPSGNVEAGQRASAIDTNGKNYLTFIGLTLKRSNALHTVGGGGLWAHNQPSTIIVDSCTITQNAGVGILIGGTSGAFTTQNSTLTYNGENAIYTNNIDNENQYILNNTIANNGWGAGAASGFGSGFQGRIKTGEIANNTIYSNGSAGPSGTQHGVYPGNQANSTLTIHDNEIYGQTNGAGITVKQSATIYNNNIHDNSTGISASDNSTNDVTYVIHHNLIANNSSTGLKEESAGAGSVTLRAYNNTIYNNGDTGNGSVKISDNLSELDFRNNIVSISAGLRIVWLNALQTGTVNINNNLYYQPSDSTPFRSVSTELDFAGWKALGYDSSGLNTDPVFVNPGTNFRLDSSSPAINTGTDVGLSSDYIGTSIPQGSAPDIGAYESLVPVVASTGLSKASGNAQATKRFLQERGFLPPEKSSTEDLLRQIRELQLRVIDLAKRLVEVLQEQVRQRSLQSA
ncbi:MAG TPA: right-handed parallel beta-helix repeat-containing protein, partial [Candidatus Paceibacterota bacterium]